jgi:hypothetical protein
MQVILFLRGLLEARGLTTVVGHARHLHGGRNAIVFRGEQYDGGIAAVVRFYQAEWLSTLRSYGALEALFVGKGTPVTNSGAAVLTESKRLPLVWDRLRASTDAFRSAMPEAREPRDAPWWTEPDRWVIKGTYSNTGDVVIFPDRCSRRQRLALAVRIAAQPTAFVAQRRFHTTPVESPRGATQPCIGVYTIDGRVAGAYARLATSNVVDGSAIDVACLVEAA